jgi:hypothetical protein
MASRPRSLQPDLVPAKASGDDDAPSLDIAAPQNRISVPGDGAVTITGTAADDHTVAGIEVSTDGGTNWYLATGTTTWTYTWTPASTDADFILSRAFDDSGNLSDVTKVNVIGGKEQPQVVSFSLINADTNQEIQILDDDATLNLSRLPTGNLNIRANTNPPTTGSVKFILQDQMSREWFENATPYALFGDTNGNFNIWNPEEGDYSLLATPYTGAGGEGDAGIPLSIRFEVVKEEGATVASRQVKEAREQVEPVANTLFAAFPNPSRSGRFTISHAEAFAGEVIYTLVSVIGTRLAAGSVELAHPAAVLELDFSRQMPTTGVYYLHLENNKTKVVFKLMRQ